MLQTTRENELQNNETHNTNICFLKGVKEVLGINDAKCETFDEIKMLFVKKMPDKILLQALGLPDEILRKEILEELKWRGIEND